MTAGPGEHPLVFLVILSGVAVYRRGFHGIKVAGALDYEPGPFEPVMAIPCIRTLAGDGR
jgi:hypothetical protein